MIPPFMETIRQTIQTDDQTDFTPGGITFEHDPDWGVRRMWQLSVDDKPPAGPESTRMVVAWEDSQSVQVRFVDTRRAEKFNDSRLSYNKLTVPGAGFVLDVDEGCTRTSRGVGDLAVGDCVRRRTFIDEVSFAGFTGNVGKIIEQNANSGTWVIEDEGGTTHRYDTATVEGNFQPGYVFFDGEDELGSQALKHRVLTMIDCAGTEASLSPRDILEDRWGIIGEDKTVRMDNPPTVLDQIRARGYDTRMRSTSRPHSTLRQYDITESVQGIEDPYCSVLIEYDEDDSTDQFPEGKVVAVNEETPAETVQDDLDGLRKNLDSLNCPPDALEQILSGRTDTAEATSQDGMGL